MAVALEEEVKQLVVVDGIPQPRREDREKYPLRPPPPMLLGRKTFFASIAWTECVVEVKNAPGHTIGRWPTRRLCRASISAPERALTATTAGSATANSSRHSTPSLRNSKLPPMTAAANPQQQQQLLLTITMIHHDA